jgi:hypothetical protein
MTIDIHNEHLLTLAQASRKLPSQPSPGTLWRWAIKGLRGVKLRSVRAGKTIITSSEALQEFLEAVHETYQPEPEMQESTNPVVEQKLRQHGMLPRGDRPDDDGPDCSLSA